ncbi:hypothetical protein A7985_02185 [Pseudoalteromonas luteoviolacea]|uniref:Uncharacterized protein n=1 Tax=Pseudoalteromonas luteoviolacea TaxID=43657 RepID=A0A1C0TTZ1_9GAMM|nr:hypothetical protein [Pseudoalteromonas luteoviolacea]MBQ4811328.1 hypothetical protein [Pseudoalteromonas luteoviolacea]OCQ22787.1 hypothetical protein A7985_02185 [Pseudoalteromonas luteoviolacea]
MSAPNSARTASKSDKAISVCLWVSLLFSIATFGLYVSDSSNFDHVFSFVKSGYMFFFVALYSYITWQWIKAPNSIVKPLFWISLLEILTLQWEQWNIGLNPFSVIGVTLSFEHFSISVNVIAITLLGFTWRYKQKLVNAE